MFGCSDASQILAIAMWRGKVWPECGLQRVVSRGLERGGDEEEEEVARVEGGAGLPCGCTVVSNGVWMLG